MTRDKQLLTVVWSQISKPNEWNDDAKFLVVNPKMLRYLLRKRPRYAAKRKWQRGSKRY